MNTLYLFTQNSKKYFITVKEEKEDSQKITDSDLDSRGKWKCSGGAIFGSSW